MRRLLAKFLFQRLVFMAQLLRSAEISDMIIHRRPIGACLDQLISLGVRAEEPFDLSCDVIIFFVEKFNEGFATHCRDQDSAGSSSK